MSEAYIFSSLLLSAGDDPLAALCRKSGLRPERIEVLHRINPPDSASSVDLPVLDWPTAPLLDHFVLQQVCAELEFGRLELAALCQTQGEQTVALLLGGPAVVGRYNLPPEARLQLLPVESADAEFLYHVASAAIGLLPEGGRITHLVGDVTAETLPLFDASQALAEHRGALFQLHALLAARAAWSVLVSRGARAGLSTLVERL
ncbi:MAG: hypothetical protein JW987_10310 [Anaerolineaceae bacterium]|nr:hypothetical protein [Anaerolineaceae bacterium]